MAFILHSFIFKMALTEAIEKGCKLELELQQGFYDRVAITNYQQIQEALNLDGVESAILTVTAKGDDEPLCALGWNNVFSNKVGAKAFHLTNYVNDSSDPSLFAYYASL